MFVGLGQIVNLKSGCPVVTLRPQCLDGVAVAARGGRAGERADQHGREIATRQQGPLHGSIAMIEGAHIFAVDRGDVGTNR